MGAARGLFNTAKTEQELSEALEFAARAIIKKDGGMETANTFLQMIDDEAAQPKEWRESKPSEAWRRTLDEIRESVQVGISPRGWRTRSQVALVAGDGAQALSDAAMAYRLVDTDDKSQELTLTAMAMAIRAVAGTVTAAERFARFQGEGPQGTVRQSGLPPIQPAEEANAQASKAWTAIQEAVAQGQSETDVLRMTRVYAGWLVRAGRLDEALGLMRAVYGTAVTEQEVRMAVSGMASLIRARDENLARSNAWREYQLYGPYGKDGKTGTADDLTDPLFDVKSPAPANWVEFWSDAADAAEAKGQWKDAVKMYLRAGRVKEAGELVRKQRTKMAFQDKVWKEHLEFATAVLRTAAGHMGYIPVNVEFLRYGKNGKDGKPGTIDDLVDPLEELPTAMSGVK